MVVSVVFMKYYKRLQDCLGPWSATLLETLCLLLVIDRIFFRILLNFFITSFLHVAPFFIQSAPHFLDLYFTSVICFALTIFIFGLEKGFISNLISKRFFVFLGELSFSIYMSHQLFFRLLIMKHWNKPLIDMFGELPVAIAAGTAVFPISYLLFSLIEDPIRKRFKKVLG
jgi:peptidoglycan/LPS O-acetylase OafA/YrhL